MWNDFSETLKDAGLLVEHQNVSGKIKQLESEIMELGEEEGESVDVMDDVMVGSFQSSSSSQFTSQDLKMLESGKGYFVVVVTVAFIGIPVNEDIHGSHVLDSHNAPDIDYRYVPLYVP